MTHSVSRLSTNALESVVVRLKKTSNDDGKRALILVMNESDPRVISQIARELNISSTVTSRAQRVVTYAPELVSRVMSGETNLHAACRVADTRRPVKRRTVEVVRLTDDTVLISSSWIGKEINQKLMTALDVICELPLPSDVAEILRRTRTGASADAMSAKVTKASLWLKELKIALDL